MLTFFADESIADNGGAEEYKVSIYGGLILTDEIFASLTKFFYKLKDRYVIPQEAEIKWTFRSYWDNLKAVGHIDSSFTKESQPNAYKSFQKDHLQMKSEILDEVAKSGAEIVVAIRPNKLLNASDEQVVEYSIRAVAKKFEKVLVREDDFGIILADELPKRINLQAVIDHQYILDLCCRGAGAGSFDRVISIVPTVNSHVSPVHQINDVALGALQFYILEFVRKLKNPTKNTDLARDIVKKIVKNFHSANDGMFIINNGILLYPPKITRINSKAGIFLNKFEKQLKEDFGII